MYYVVLQFDCIHSARMGMMPLSHYDKQAKEAAGGVLILLDLLHMFFYLRFCNTYLCFGNKHYAKLQMIYFFIVSQSMAERRLPHIISIMKQDHQ